VKKTIIGSVFMLSGIIVTISVIITAALYVPSITAWSGSKLWYAIFGAKQYGNEVVQSLFLGAPFVIGIILAAIGLIMLVVEYCRKEN
jgi:ABC-type dipeptide/oligopeptide/nickel transport system permease subunit